MFNEKELSIQNKKLCSFYVSDYHFEMISLPYIESEIRNNHQIIILAENDLQNTIKKLLSCTTLNENTKKKVFEIGWEQTDINDLYKVANHLKENQLCTIFIKGSADYIQKVDSYINKNIYSTLKIVHCYSTEEVGTDIKKITNQYDGVLNTIGEKNL